MKFLLKFLTNETSEDRLADGRFAQEVIALLSRERPALGTHTTDEPDVIGLEVAGQSLPANLENLFTQLGNFEAAHHDDIILEHFDALVAGMLLIENLGTASFVEVREKLYPQLMASTTRAGDPSVLTSPLSAKACVGYIVDGGASMAYVKSAWLEGWGVSAEDVHGAAIANLDRLVANDELDVTPADSGEGALVICEAGDSYESSRILSPAYLAKLHASLGEKCYIGVPNRDFLIAWSADCDSVLKHSFRGNILEDAQIQAYPRTPELFVAEHGRVRLANGEEELEHVAILVRA